MSVDELIKQRRLDEALAALHEQVRQSPGKAQPRAALFELLCVLGQWDKALRQMSIAAELAPGEYGFAAGMARSAIACERARARVFAGREQPVIFGEPQAWMASMVQALQIQTQGHAEAAQRLRAEALVEAPAATGRIDESPFDWLADADARLGPVLECFVNGRYFWMPMPTLTWVRIEAPTTLLELVWVSAHLTWTNGGEAAVLLPVRYAGSEASDDPAIRLSYATDWTGEAETGYLGLGQRSLITDQGGFRLLDVRSIAFETVGGEPAAMDAGAEDA